MKRWIYLALLFASGAILSAQSGETSPAVVRKVEIIPADDEIRVEITLSLAVAPSVETAKHPDRLVVKLPGTVSGAAQKRIAVAKLGVRSIRYGLNQATPPETHVVLDLEQEHSYKILTDDNKIILVVDAPLSLSARRRKGPAGAASRPLISTLGRRNASGETGNKSKQDGVLLTPPPWGPPIAFPRASSDSSSSTAKASNEPAPAKRANTGSPQQGTVFPNAGPPGTGQVPPGSGQPEPSGLDAKGRRTLNVEKRPAEDESSTQAHKSVAKLSPETTSASEDLTASGRGTVRDQLQQPARAGENADLRTAFRVKYVAQDAAYLDGGRAAGLTEGMKLIVRDLPNSGAVASGGSDSTAAGDVAELEVLSVAETSSVTEIHAPKRPVRIGDLAYLSPADQQSMVERNALSATRKYPAVVSFTESDTLDDEARAEVPKPPLPSVNRARGRIGLDYINVMNHDGSGMQSSNLGMVLRADITRLNGTYWNVSGYWRGRFNHTTAGTETLQDLLNRTYHLYMSYDNPNSAWVAGFGRLYLPWATSLDTLDGGYFGRRVKQGVTAGLFLGSTPDPTSYSYAPNREIAGAFVNFEGGSYDDLHYSSTSGGGLKMMSWSPNRPFVFAENNIFYKRIFSIYQAAQMDSQPGYAYTNPDGTIGHQPRTGFGLGRSFLTMRVQLHPRVELSFNHTYFRDLPSFDPSLIQTGLLDKYLMQGFSAGTRIEVYKQVWLSADLGLSDRTGDKKTSLNQMFGITFGRLPWINMHADARYSRFTSSFGSGSYEALSLSKNVGETLQLQILAGQQNFASTISAANRSRFINGTVETSLGEHYFVQAGGTINRGNQMNYDQWLFTFGYRFDNRHGRR